MKHPILATFTLLAFTSCKTSVVFHPSQPGRPFAPPTDTVLVLKLSDEWPLPPHEFFIGTIDCRFHPGTVYFDSLVGSTIAQARKVGGNVLKLTGAQYLGGDSHLKWDVYSLSDPNLKAYRSLLDTAESAYQASLQGRAVVHLLDEDQFDSSPIFFVDSLVAIMKKGGYKADLQFDRPGRLRIFHGQASLKIFNRGGKWTLDPTPTAEMSIQTGKEYYIVLMTSISGRRIVHRFGFTNREGYEDPNMLFIQGVSASPPPPPPLPPPRRGPSSQ